MRWEVYILRTRSGKLYTGITTDVERRFREHSEGRGGKFFRSSPPEKIVYRERKRNRSTASRRESEIKHMSRAQKVDLIRNRPA